MHCPASGIRGTVYPVVYGKLICYSSVSRYMLPVIWLYVNFVVIIQKSEQVASRRDGGLIFRITECLRVCILSFHRAFLISVSVQVTHGPVERQWRSTEYRRVPLGMVAQALILALER